MINLLPYTLRQQIKARQHNNILVKSFVILLLASVILIIAHRQLNSLIDNQHIKINKKQNLTDDEKDISEQSTKLFSLLSVIQLNERNYQLSDYALDITNRLPDSITIKQLIIKPEDITNRQIKITCFSKNPNDFISLKSAFQDSKLIEKTQISPVSEVEGENLYSVGLTLYLRGDSHEKEKD